MRGLPVLLEAQGPSYQEFTRLSMHTGLPTVQGWEYHTQQRGHSQAETERRKADVTAAYTSADEEAVRRILLRYHVALVAVGNLERRTYAGANLARFESWTDLLTPVYRNPEVGSFRGEGRLRAGHRGGPAARGRAAVFAAERAGAASSARRRRGPRAPAPRSGLGRGRANLGRGFRQPAGAALRRGRLSPPRVRDARKRARTVQRSLRHRGRPDRPRLRGGHVERPRAGLRRQGRLAARMGRRLLRPSRRSPWTRAARSSSRTRGTGGSCASTASGTRRPSGGRRTARASWPTRRASRPARTETSTSPTTETAASRSSTATGSSCARSR